MIRRYADLIFTLLLTAVVLVSLLGDQEGSFFKLSAALFVLFTPGYAITTLIFKHGVLDWPAKLAYAIGISLAVSVVGGVAINGAGALLTKESWTIFLATVVIVASFISLLRRKQTTCDTPNGIIFQAAFGEFLLLTFCVLTIGGGLYLGWKADRDRPDEPFTEFWMIPQNDNVSAVEVGLHNHEKTTRAYDISISINGEEVIALEHGLVESGQKWIKTYTLPSKISKREKIVAKLYKDGNHATVYRWTQVYR